MERLLYRVDEACVATGVGRTKLYDEINAGRLGAVRIGKSVRIPADELHAYIERAKAQGPAAKARSPKVVGHQFEKAIQ